MSARTLACVMLLCAIASPAFAEEGSWARHDRPPFLVLGTALVAGSLLGLRVADRTATQAGPTETEEEREHRSGSTPQYEADLPPGLTTRPEV